MRISVDPQTRTLTIAAEVPSETPNGQPGQYAVTFDFWQTIGLAAQLEMMSRLIEPPAPDGRTYMTTEGR